MAIITKTLGPIHFEDLDPHRFEDLVRELIYDFKEWQDIEATGKVGGDDGFDARAWEKISPDEDFDVDGDDEKEVIQEKITEGNLWMIQCKREKELGPKRVSNIINEGVDSKNPPYGYILAAPANFSKKAHDTFRNELRKRGVMEFHLWGKPILEDMLHMPKNDHILFTFFGISLLTRKRARKTEVRFTVVNKNKLLRVLGGGSHDQDMFKSVLIRDIDDKNYPFKDKYKDFDKNPKWMEETAISMHPLGLVLRTRKYFAYIDRKKKEFDFVKSRDLMIRQDDRNNRQKEFESEMVIRDFWSHLPRENQAYLEIEPIVLYEDILLIDDKGDVSHNYPHIYCEYKYAGTPYKATWHYLTSGKEYVDVDTQNYKRVDYFPKKFTKSPKARVLKNKYLEPDTETVRLLKNGYLKEIYDVDGKYDFLRPRDKIQVKGSETKTSYDNSVESVNGIEIMHKYKMNIKDFLANKDTYVREVIERQVGRKVDDKEKLTIYEVEYVGSWAFPKQEEKISN